MTKGRTFGQQLKRLIASSVLASTMLAGGFSLEAANASTATSNDGVLATAASVSLNSDLNAAQASKFKRGKMVQYSTNLPVGTIVVNTHDNVLYFVLGNGNAVQFRVATAKPGFGWTGIHKVSSKAQWPDWRPPTAMRKRRPELPAFVAGGPGNPLGARALYLGSSIYRIHGTNDPKSIGSASSSGCIRMLNADVEELYRHAKIGTTVVVI
jgi:lipoprotein-anchoring transpeptidase ErfK/SrfK